ncbi:MAG TPA: ABC transporter permease [Candidatus Deferrimicrobium sp.]|nr:ABC transporter permease [Candidatus Deferrimicrobium sp.]
MNLNRVKHIVVKEFIHIFRDKPSLAIAFMMPIMFLLLFGYAVTTDINNIDTVILDQDNTQESRALIQAFRNSNYYTVLGGELSYSGLKDAVDQGRAKAGLIIPHGYAEKLLRGEQSQVQMVIDGSDPSVARTVFNSGQLIAQMKSTELRTTALEKSGMLKKLPAGIDLRPRVWYNPEMTSQKFNIPALIGLVLQNITIILTAFALVRERERGTLEQLIVTPVKSRELIIGKLIPYIVIAFFDVGIVLTLGVFWFGVPIAGSTWLLLGLSAIFLLSALGLGMFISTVAKTQLQAMQAALMLLLPSILLSGFMFPREAMPKFIFLLGYLFPLTYFIQILRGIILKGLGFTQLWSNIWPLTVFGICIIILSSLRFRKRLD